MSQWLHQIQKPYGKEIQWQLANYSGWYGKKKLDIHSSKIVIDARDVALFEGTIKWYKPLDLTNPLDLTKTITGVKSGQSIFLHAFQNALIQFFLSTVKVRAFLQINRIEDLQIYTF